MSFLYGTINIKNNSVPQGFVGSLKRRRRLSKKIRKENRKSIENKCCRSCGLSCTLISHKLVGICLICYYDVEVNFDDIIKCVKENKNFNSISQWIYKDAESDPIIRQKYRESKLNLLNI